MYRKIKHFLESWKESKHRNPLILLCCSRISKTVRYKNALCSPAERCGFCEESCGIQAEIRDGQIAEKTF